MDSAISSNRLKCELVTYIEERSGAKLHIACVPSRHQTADWSANYIMRCSFCGIADELVLPRHFQDIRERDRRCCQVVVLPRPRSHLCTISGEKNATLTGAECAVRGRACVLPFERNRAVSNGRCDAASAREVLNSGQLSGM